MPSARNGGIFLTGDKGYANAFAGNRDGANVMPVYVHAENPRFIDPEQYSSDEIEMAMIDNNDALITRDATGNIGIVVAFRPEQIKSATGNSGTFDPSKPSKIGRAHV